jgi:PAS domain S-box-containing protein
MDIPLRVLIIEDSDRDVALEVRALKAAGYQVTYAVAETAVEMKAALAEQVFDIVISDNDMPQFDAAGALAVLKQSGMDIPFIIVSGSIGQEIGVALMKAGAHDFVMKDSPARLVPAVQRELRDAESRKERKRAEEKLRESEEQYRTLVENASDIVFRLDDTGHITFVNPAAIRITGYEEEEIIGRHYPTFIRPDMQEEAIKFFGRQFVKGIPNTYSEYPVIMKDGREIWFGQNTQLIFRDGKVIAFQAVARDITDRKRSEDKLISSEKRLRDFNELQGLMLQPNPIEQKLKLVTETVVRIVGADFVRIWMIKPGDRCQAGCIHAQMSEGPHICRFRDRCLHLIASSGRYTHTNGRDHSRVPFGSYKIGMIAAGEESKFLIKEVTNDPRVHNHMWAKELGLMSFAGYQLVDANGTSNGVLALFSKQEITTEEDLLLQGIADATSQVLQSAQAEDELRESEERLRDIMFSIADWVWEVDENGVYTYSSQKGSDFFGESRRDIIGKTPFDFMPPDEAKRVAAIFSEIVANKAPIKDLENWNIQRNGERICLLTNGVPILDKEGNLKGYRGVDKDITERKQSEKQLQDTLENLRKSFDTIIQVMVSAVEARDPYTSGHQIRSADLARSIAKEMGLPQEKIDAIRMAGSIHDVGKLSIPAEILSKPTKLAELEFSMIKEHARKGFDMLKDVESPWPLAEIVYQHHERMDGSGYPRNLKGEEILIEARILTVADVVEAMASHRPYRAGLGIDAALNEIEKNRGIFYDNAVADACLRLFREKGFKLEVA